MADHMYGKIELISPKIADEFLQKSRHNRLLREGRIRKYVCDAKEGRWFLSPHGLCFDVEGYFCDGHHRCRVVIESGVTLPFFVIRNVPKEVLPYLDCGMPRCAKDALSMAGRGEFTAEFITTARVIEGAPYSLGMPFISPADVLPIIERHAEALQFSCNLLRSKIAGISRSTRALLARAWYTSDTTRLEEFAAVLISGKVVDPNRDGAAVAFRNYTLRQALGAGGSGKEDDRYRKGASALRAFLDGKNLDKLYSAKLDLFPLPAKTDDDGT